MSTGAPECVAGVRAEHPCPHGGWCATRGRAVCVQHTRVLREGYQAQSVNYLPSVFNRLEWLQGDPCDDGTLVLLHSDEHFLWWKERDGILLVYWKLCINIAAHMNCSGKIKLRITEI